MSEISEEIRYVMLFYYKKGKNAAQTCRKICEVYGADAVSERKRRTQELFIQFRSGNFDVKDRPRSDRSVTEKVDEILQLVEQDRHVSCQEIINALRINHVTVWNDLKKAGYAKKLDVWVPHELTQRNLIDRISISEILLKRNEIDPFLKQIITGDEKWVKYKNIVRK
ncbi:Histone-lysine N-methyltransferase SETMAR, partial [Acromyrmex echinatior]